MFVELWEWPIIVVGSVMIGWCLFVIVRVIVEVVADRREEKMEKIAREIFGYEYAKKKHLEQLEHDARVRWWHL